MTVDSCLQMTYKIYERINSLEGCKEWQCDSDIRSTEEPLYVHNNIWCHPPALAPVSPVFPNTTAWHTKRVWFLWALVAPAGLGWAHGLPTLQCVAQRAQGINISLWPARYPMCRGASLGNWSKPQHATLTSLGGKTLNKMRLMAGAVAH